MIGIRWGAFVGSPESDVGEPTIVLTNNKLPANRGLYQLMAMPEGHCIVFPVKTQMIVKNRVEKRGRLSFTRKA